MSEDTSIAISPIQEKPHVSALLWEDILGTPFKPHTETIDGEKKTRGRPRKHVPTNDGKVLHQVSDAEPETRNLLPSTIHKIILDYKEYVQEGMKPKAALDEICKLYRVPYGQAFNILADEM